MNTSTKPIRWYKTPIDKQLLRQLMEKKDGPGLRRLGITFLVLVLLGAAAYFTLGTLWSLLLFFVYGSVYVLFAMSAMHETHHRTAFKTEWINAMVNWICGFMIHKEPLFDRYRHLQHHANTAYPERDPEMYGIRPPAGPWLLPLVALLLYPLELLMPFVHATGYRPAYVDGRMQEKQWRSIVWSSRLFVLVVLGIVALSVYFQSWLPLVYTLLVPYYGGLLANFVISTQHIGLGINTPDHRLNTRTTYMHPLISFLYWDMNYHLEHHMYAGVPFHNLSALHRHIKYDQPEPVDGFLRAVRLVLPAWKQQRRQPEYSLPVRLPDATGQSATG